MVWLLFAALTLAAMAPLAIAATRRTAARGRRQAALALHRAQLAELDREREAGRIAPAEHAQAVLEVQRRLLAAGAEAEPPETPASRQPLLAALLMVPVAAFGLYLAGGSPFLPGAPLAERQQAARAQAARDDALIGELRRALARLDPRSPQGRDGYILLGNAEAGRGNMAAAADAWRTALGGGFDAALAMQAAEAETEAEGRVTPRARALFEQSLAASPPGAPWRRMIEKRLGGDPQ